MFSGGGEPSAQYRDFSATADPDRGGAHRGGRRARPLRRDLHDLRVAADGRAPPPRPAPTTGTPPGPPRPARPPSRGVAVTRRRAGSGNRHGRYLLDNDAAEADGPLHRLRARCSTRRRSAISTALGLAAGLALLGGGGGRHRRWSRILADAGGARGPRPRHRHRPVVGRRDGRRAHRRGPEHDVAADPPPGGPFDLVHARLVLVHVPERDAALDAHGGSPLRPGGCCWSRTPTRRCSR